MEYTSNILDREWPRQKLLYSKKNTAWRRACVDAVIRYCSGLKEPRRSPIKNKIRNYNLLNNKIDKSDFDYSLNPFNLTKDKLDEFQLPASLQPYDVISPTFMLLFGEESKRIFNPIVRGMNEGVVSAKQEQKKQVILQMLDQTLRIKLGFTEEEKDITPEQVQKYLNYSPKDMRESVMEKLLTYYRKKLNLHDIFQAGWKDALVAGEEIYRIEKVGNGPKVSRVNTLGLDYILPPNCDQIDYADMIREREYMTLPQIVDEFFEYLSDEEITRLEENFSDFRLSPSSLYYNGIQEVESIYEVQNQNDIRGIPVYRVRWKSFRKMGYFHSMNPDTLEEIVELVDEDFKTNPDNKFEWIEWMWINEYWEGVRIGDETSGIYLNIRRCPIQYRTLENPTVCRSGYVGTLYNALNAQSVSLMDRLVPWVYLYFIIWYNTELLISTNLGKIAQIDSSLMPPGWEPEKWLKYVKAMRIAFVNSYNDGRKAEKYGEVNQSTHTKALDLEMGNSIQYNLNLLEFIEQKIEMTSGISRQRKGAISSSELVGNTQRAVMQSSHITEEWFRVHNYTKVRVCEAILEVAKLCLQDGGNKVMQYITDDLTDVLFQVDGNDLEIDHAVFVTDMAKDQEALQAFKDNLRFALQSDKIEFSQIVDVYNSESIADLKNKTRRIEEERAAREQQQIEAQQQMAQEQLEKQEKMEMLKLELQKYIADTNNQTKLAVAEINSYMGREDVDLDDNAIPDTMEISKLALQQQESLSKQMAEKMKLATDIENKRAERNLKNKELKLKEKEMTDKSDLEWEKLKVERENMKNDITVAKINAKNRNKSK